MESLTHNPLPTVIPGDIWTETDIRRREEFKGACEEIVKPLIHFEFGKTDQQMVTDEVHEYSMQLLSLGCFYLEYSDAIQEGDGN